MDKISPIHPGEVLLEEFIEPLGLTQHRVAVAIGVPPRRLRPLLQLLPERLQLLDLEGDDVFLVHRTASGAKDHAGHGPLGTTFTCSETDCTARR